MPSAAPKIIFFAILSKWSVNIFEKKCFCYMRQLGLGQNLKLKDLFIYTLCSKHFQNVNLVKKKFAVKMILRGIKFWATSNSQKLSVLAISEALNLDFDKFEHFFKSQIHKNSKLRVPEILKWPFLRFKFRINCSHVNLGGNWQLNSWIFHTVGLNFTFLKFLEHSAMNL